PGLSHNELRRADAKPVPDMNGFVVESALRGEVFAESSPDQISVWKLIAPERIVLRRVNVNRLIDSSVYRQIRLLVAIQVHVPHLHAACYRRFEDRCPNDPSVPFHFARKANVYGQEFHSQLLQITDFRITVTFHSPLFSGGHSTPVSSFGNCFGSTGYICERSISDFEPCKNSNSSGAPRISQITSSSVSLNTWRNCSGATSTAPYFGTVNVSSPMRMRPVPSSTK